MEIENEDWLPRYAGRILNLSKEEKEKLEEIAKEQNLQNPQKIVGKNGKDYFLLENVEETFVYDENFVFVPEEEQYKVLRVFGYF